MRKYDHKANSRRACQCIRHFLSRPYCLVLVPDIIIACIKVKACSYIKRYLHCTSLHGLLKAHYVHFIPGSPVNSENNQASLGSIQPCWNYCAQTVHALTYSTIAYSRECSCTQLSEPVEASWREQKCPSFERAVKGIQIGALSI